ncbi:uncharacterized protein LOC123396433 isoform X2 [Hordeum vulgare subsp. vulgare]|uniref:uncharacterized protein LOC123396433 isoform X2 n=1 Tax=Hordeum vulgare subsp. vulgare TaxID=112509 RepID=UPI001D1A5077|nr:uncharacterized protein LOC123396433 isoform X2 [Hordeum vulgare subsp. vulgare]
MSARWRSSPSASPPSPWRWATQSHTHTHSTTSTSPAGRDEVAVNAIWLGQLSCVALMAAGAVLIPCGRRWVNRALVCLGLALATAGNCLYATAACMFLVAHLGDLFSRILCIVGIFAYALGLPGPPSME